MATSLSPAFGRVGKPARSSGALRLLGDLTMRYQLVPFSSGPGIDRERAMRAARSGGAKYPCMAAPIMSHIDVYNRVTGATWRGTNQPAVLVFTAPSDEVARAVQEAYGGDTHLEYRATALRV